MHHMFRTKLTENIRKIFIPVQLIDFSLFSKTVFALSYLCFFSDQFHFLRINSFMTKVPIGAKQWSGFYIIGTSVKKELNIIRKLFVTSSGL